MTDFNLQNKVTNTGCSPSMPPPNPPGTDENDYCEGTLAGSLSGTIRMQNCCKCLYSRTFIIDVSPQTDAQLLAYIQNTVNSYEQAGYVILAHSLKDQGGTTLLGLTVGWYA